MKKLLYIITTIITFSLTSCLDVVDFDPTNRYSQSLGFKDETNANLYLNSFYPILHQFGQFGGSSMGGNSCMSDGLTDILKYSAIVAGAGDPNLIMTVENHTNVASNQFNTWSGGYTWIRKINEYLEGLDANKNKFSDTQYNRLKAEALFFRAYSYFLIMRSHASVKDNLGVIIYSQLSQMTVSNKNQPRATVAASYDFIAEDITFATNNLPEPAKSAGRLNKYAAAALKARIMLYAERYTQAQEAALLIQGAPEYDYINNYSDIFKSLTNKEVIYGYEFKFATLYHGFDVQMTPAADITSCGGYAGPTQEFVDMFDNADGTTFNAIDNDDRYITDANVHNRDPRLKASVLYNQTLWKNRSIECYEGGRDQDDMPYGSKNAPGNTVTGYYMRKLLDESNLEFRDNGSTQPWIEFRYAEAMLILAECYAKEGTSDGYSKAWGLVNELRKKRFNREDVFTPPITSWESALNVILKERAIELCYEGHRFWDLRRTGRAIQVLHNKSYTGVWWKKNSDGSFSPRSVSCEMGARRYPERFDRFPIPQAEISNNLKAVQNSDW